MRLAKLSNRLRAILFLLSFLIAHVARGDETVPGNQPVVDGNSQSAVQHPPTTRATSRPSDFTGADLTNLSIDELMNVDVTSVDKTKEHIADAPAAITVISQSDIERSGLDQIPEILRLSPGIFVQRGNQLTDWSVAARGFADVFSNKLQVVEDGRTIYTPYFAGVYWDMVDYPIADLDRIEVIRGSGATMWGSNAVNGVINITTKSADETQGLFVDSRVGTDESDASVRYGGKLDDETYYRVYAKGRSFDDEGGVDDQWQDTHGGFRMDRYASPSDTLTLQGDILYQSLSDDQVPGVPNIPNYSHDYHSGGNVLGRWTHTDSDDSDFSLQFYYDRFNQRDAFVDYRLDTYDVDFQDRFQLDRHNELTWGAGARVQRDALGSFFLSQPMVTPFSKTADMFSAFVQDTVTILPDRWHFFIGSKVEDNTFTGFEYQPSARLLWTPNDTSSVWAAVSRSVRVPSRWNEDANFVFPVPAPTPTDIAVFGGNGHLSSEQLISYEIGYRQQVNKSVSMDITSFVNDYDNLISLQTLSPVTLPGTPAITEFPTQWANIQHAEEYGAELAANWQVTPSWHLEGSYSLLEAYVHNDNASAAARLVPAVQNSYPTNMLQAHSYLDLTKNIQFNASIYYYSAIGSGGIVVPGTGPGVGAYTRGDMNITWLPTPDLLVAIGVQNAFDSQHQEATTGMGSQAAVLTAYYTQLSWRF